LFFASEPAVPGSCLVTHQSEALKPATPSGQSLFPYTPSPGGIASTDLGSKFRRFCAAHSIDSISLALDATLISDLRRKLELMLRQGDYQGVGRRFLAEWITLLVVHQITLEVGPHPYEEAQRGIVQNQLFLLANKFLQFEDNWQPDAWATLFYQHPNIAFVGQQRVGAITDFACFSRFGRELFVIEYNRADVVTRAMLNEIVVLAANGLSRLDCARDDLGLPDSLRAGAKVIQQVSTALSHLLHRAPQASVKLCSPTLTARHPRSFSSCTPTELAASCSSHGTPPSSTSSTPSTKSTCPYPSPARLSRTSGASPRRQYSAHSSQCRFYRLMAPTMSSATSLPAPHRAAENRSHPGSFRATPAGGHSGPAAGFTDRCAALKAHRLEAMGCWAMKYVN
jgi:hypothetical protein